MIRTVISFVAGAALAGLSAVDAAAQDNFAPRPGYTAKLSASRGVVSANGTVELVLGLTINEPCQLPGALLTGMTLAVQVDDEAGPKIDDAGKGGLVDFVPGTRVERRIRIPASRFVPAPAASGFSTVAVSWTGVVGANCVFKIAPDASKLDIAKLDHSKTKVVLLTNHGEMTLSFRPDKAPKHVQNFLELAKKGYYDGTKFHRVIRGFMIQGGCPNSKHDSKRELWGRGDPGYKIDAEFNDVRHVRGVLSMARGPDPNSAGSQFFICHKDSPQLDNQYTAFGNLESGADTLDSIANTPCTGRKRETPVEPVILHSVVILPVLKG